MILVVGASGRLGSEVTRLLLAQGKTVRVMTRTPSKVDDLASLGAEVVVGDLRDAESLRQAFRGIHQVVTTAHGYPGDGNNNPHTVDAIGNRRLIETAKATGVSHFVFTSALGARPDNPVDFLRIKYYVEQMVRTNVLGYTILRPAAFMESWIETIGKQIVEKGELTVYGRGDNPINFVSADDVAKFAVLALESPKVQGRVVEIGGPENLTFLQVAETLERIVGRSARRKYVSLLTMRIVAYFMFPINPAMSRQITAGVNMASADMAFDPTPALNLLPMQLKRLEEVAERMYALPSNGLSPGAVKDLGVNGPG